MATGSATKMPLPGCKGRIRRDSRVAGTSPIARAQVATDHCCADTWTWTPDYEFTSDIKPTPSRT
jgi:hypothetical protein